MWTSLAFNPGKVGETLMKASPRTYSCVLWVALRDAFSGHIGSEAEGRQGSQQQRWHLLLRAAIKLLIQKGHLYFWGKYFKSWGGFRDSLSAQTCS